MTQQTYSRLQDLQELDEEIERLKRRIAEFQPELDEVEEPAVELEGEVETTEERLQELQVEERRLELSAEQKRERLSTLQDRLKEVRNVREEAAVQAELDMVRRAAESDEKEALSLLDQIRKFEQRLEDQREELEEARREVEPRRRQLVEDRDAARERLEELQARREAFASRIDEAERKTYETIRSGGRDVAVAPLTPDGACSNCYGMVPIQRRNELRHGNEMIRCDACGVILAPSEAEQDEAEQDGDEE